MFFKKFALSHKHACLEPSAIDQEYVTLVGVQAGRSRPCRTAAAAGRSKPITISLRLAALLLGSGDERWHTTG